VNHVRGADTRELRAVVDNALSLPNENVHLDGAVEVDETDASQRRLSPVDPDANHLAVERKVSSWSPQRTQGQRTCSGRRRRYALSLRFRVVDLA
jgi:hypothetical protein